MSRRQRITGYAAIAFIVWELHRLADVLFTGGHPALAISSLTMIALLLYPRSSKRTTVREEADR